MLFQYRGENLKNKDSLVFFFTLSAMSYCNKIRSECWGAEEITKSFT